MIVRSVFRHGGGMSLPGYAEMRINCIIKVVTGAASGSVSWEQYEHHEGSELSLPPLVGVRGYALKRKSRGSPLVRKDGLYV